MSWGHRTRVAMAGLALAGVLAGAGTAVGVGDRPAPGLYKVTSVIAGEAPRVREECLSAADIAEAFALPKGAGCVTSRTVAGGGRIDLAQSCSTGKRVTAGAITGTYTPAGYTLRVQSRAPELPKPLDIRMTAQRLGACQSD